MRTGVIVKKLGMSAFFLKSGDKVPVTLLQIQNCQVVSHITKEKNGYDALLLGSEDVALNKLSKSLKTIFAKSKIKPKRFLREFRISSDAFVEIGVEIDARHFVEGQKIDVSGVSVGKGFAGTMKRHNFGGLEASHGVSIAHRSAGSTGGCQDPGKVFKNKKMAGQLGNKMVTKQNLEVVLVDAEVGIVAVKGSVPGAKGSMLLLSDSVKLGMPLDAPYPTFVPKDVVADDSAANL